MSTGHTRAERNKASRIRAKGAKAAPHERSWLSQYEASRGKPGRRPRAATVESTRVDSAGASERTTFAPAEAMPPPPNPGVPPASGPGPDVPPLPFGGAVGEAPPPPPRAEDEAKTAAVAMLVDMVAKAWVNAMEDLRVKTGAESRMFPDAFVDQIWKPAATRLGVKYLPDSVSGDAADIVAVTLPPAATVVAIRRLPKLPPRDDSAPARPAGAEPTKPDAAAAPTPASNVREFKKQLATVPSPKMPEGSVF